MLFDGVLQSEQAEPSAEWETSATSFQWECRAETETSVLHPTQQAPGSLNHRGRSLHCNKQKPAGCFPSIVQWVLPACHDCYYSFILFPSTDIIMICSIVALQAKRFQPTEAKSFSHLPSIYSGIDDSVCKQLYFEPFSKLRLKLCCLSWLYLYRIITQRGLEVKEFLFISDTAAQSCRHVGNSD